MAASSNAPDLPGILDLELVGRGGFAFVYRGRQPAFQRDVAVKVIQRSGLDSDDRRRFERECKAMGALSDHPGIVTLYGADFTADGQPYLVMPYIAGGTLEDQLTGHGAMAWQEVIELGVHLCGALETAHRAGVLHRDIKPANVLRSPYGGQLSDFGIARIQGGHETRTGVVTASLAHAPPEILDGSAPTARGDVYSLASTLFEALTGRAPFVRDTDEGIVPMMRRVMVEPPPDLRGHGVPDPVATVVETGMAKDPNDRYPSAEAFGQALREAQQALGVPASRMAIVGDPIGDSIGDSSGLSDPTPAAMSAPAETPTPEPDAPLAAAPLAAVPEPASPPGPTTVLGDAASPSAAEATTVIPAQPSHVPPHVPPGGPPPPRSGGSGMAALIAFVLLLVLAAGVTAFFVLTADGNGGNGGTAVPTVAPDTTVAVETTVEAPDPTAATSAPAPTTEPGPTLPDSTPPPSPEQLAFATLQDLVAEDASRVDLLAEQWVPQLSAKREGLDVGGTTFGFEEILADHQERRDMYGAVIVDGATYNFRIDDAPMVGWYITVVPLGFPDAQGALDWCLDQGIDRANCVAKFISSTVFENTLRLNP